MAIDFPGYLLLFQGFRMAYSEFLGGLPCSHWPAPDPFSFSIAAASGAFKWWKWSLDFLHHHVFPAVFSYCFAQIFGRQHFPTCLPMAVLPVCCPNAFPAAMFPSTACVSPPGIGKNQDNALGAHREKLRKVLAGWEREGRVRLSWVVRGVWWAFWARHKSREFFHRF